MPLYEYECSKCGTRFEKIEKMDAPHRRKCPKCGARADRLLASPAIHFKGSGWYVTDYGGRGAVREASEAKESKDTKEAKETKPAAKEKKAHTK